MTRRTAARSTAAAVLAILVATVSVIRAQAPAGAPDIAALSGKWSGTGRMIQRGKCVTSAGAQLVYPVEGAFSFEADGTLNGTVYAGPESQRPKQSSAWTGRAATDGTVEIRAVADSICHRPDGTAYTSRYAVPYAGKLTGRKGRYKIEISGDDSPCPEFGCTFTQVIELSHKVPKTPKTP